MLKPAKQAILSALRLSGFSEKIADSEWRRNRVLILAYHGVSLKDEHMWDSNLYMSAEMLEQRFASMRKHRCSVISLQEALRGFETGNLPPRSVVLTFDDGFYDFYAVALPLLRKYGYPATLYVTTYYSEFNRPIFRLICSYLLWQRRRDRVDLSGFAGWNGPAKDELLSHLTRFAEENHLSASAQDDLAASLAARLNIDYGAILKQRILHLLNEIEIQELSAAGIDIQLHTHRHRTPHDRDLFLREIEDNRSYIQRTIGATASHFCYPSGVHESAFLPWLRQAQVLSGTTCDPGLTSARSNRLLLPRVVDHGDLSPIEFESWLTGVGSLLPHRRVTRYG